LLLRQAHEQREQTSLQQLRERLQNTEQCLQEKHTDGKQQELQAQGQMVQWQQGQLDKFRGQLQTENQARASRQVRHEERLRRQEIKAQAVAHQAQVDHLELQSAARLQQAEQEARLATEQMQHRHKQQAWEE
jgi:hypothetical protein